MVFVSFTNTIINILFPEATNAMAPKIKITYFHCSPEIKLRARVEIARLVLAAAKKEYDYSSVGFGEWPALKPSKREG